MLPCVKRKQREDDMQATGSLKDALKEHFGYESFLPLQQEITQDSLAGRDVFALLPTGGGKSLCYQLPALLRSGVTVVISPLIALMKDQVDALKAGGIAAAYINSSLTFSEQQKRGRELIDGKYRLLYVAPERVMTSMFLGFLKKLDVGLIAIDEAHCISEWGHDFRPEYRQLAQLRPRMPNTPVMALTATATERVRTDILEQLHLKDPAVHIGSFNRRNLTYHVRAKKGSYEQLLAFVRSRPGESGIVYCHARKTTESLAEQLSRDGVVARAYHAGLEPSERTRNQEAFARDEVPVVCATIAFGMGINKSNVRYVFHYDMPKSIEAYHQETGRAGRDGLPADCVMLFSTGDAVRYDRFADEKEDPAQREASREQLKHIVAYSESQACRRKTLLAYFGETYDAPNCNGCDNCLDPTPKFDATEAVRKFLACVFRIRQKSGFSVGIAHVSAVLAGADTERVRKLAHEELSAFGAGKEHTQAEWQDIGRQLVALKLLRQNPDRMNALELTTDGMNALREHRQVMLKELRAPQVEAARAALPPCDEPLYQRLRDLRNKLARERNIAAFMIFSDVALRQMAREYPEEAGAFRRINGVGESKLTEFGTAFMAEITDHVTTAGRQSFDSEAPAYYVGSDRLGVSARESLARFRAGEEIADIAQSRGLATSTILAHLGIAAESGESVELERLITPQQADQIAGAFATLGWANILGVSELLGEAYEHGLLRLYRAVHGPGREPSSAEAKLSVKEKAAGNASPSARAVRTRASRRKNPESASVAA
jgi:ATP-dependent DNA helicase RecQ